MKIKLVALIMVLLLSVAIQSCVWDVPKDIPADESTGAELQAELHSTFDAYQKINVVAEGAQSEECGIYYPPEACFFATAEVVEVCSDKAATTAKLKLLSIETAPEKHTDSFAAGDTIKVIEPYYMIADKDEEESTMVIRNYNESTVMGIFLPMLEGKKYFIAFAPTEDEVTHYYAFPMFNFLNEDGYKTFNFYDTGDELPDQEFLNIDDLYLPYLDEPMTVRDYYVSIPNMFDSYNTINKYYNSDEANKVFASISDWKTTKQD